MNDLQLQRALDHVNFHLSPGLRQQLWAAYSINDVSFPCCAADWYSSPQGGDPRFDYPRFVADAVPSSQDEAATSLNWVPAYRKTGSALFPSSAPSHLCQRTLLNVCSPLVFGARPGNFAAAHFAGGPRAPASHTRVRAPSAASSVVSSGAQHAATQHAAAQHATADCTARLSAIRSTHGGAAAALPRATTRGAATRGAANATVLAAASQYDAACTGSTRYFVAPSHVVLLI